MPARRAWCVLTGAIIAVGCGGGSNPSPGTGGPWLPFAGQGVFAVNRSAPSAAPITVDATSNVGGLRLVQSGTYDPATGAASSLQPDTAVWAAAGKIWRPSAAAGGSPNATQVSSENSVGDPSPLNPTPTHLCDTAVLTDWAIPGESRYLYTLAGQDTRCGDADDVVKLTRLTAPTTEGPITVPGRLVTAVQSPSTGAITGTLDRLRWSGSKGLLRGFTPGTGGALYGEILFADVATARCSA